MLQAVSALPHSLLVCAAVVAVGCTMCPDPYDYSGPVPNGSPPQNEFRARSQGILPLGTAPKPFPAVVKAVPGPAPAAASRLPAVADAAEGDVRRLSAEEPAAETADTDAATPAEIAVVDRPVAEPQPEGEPAALSAGEAAAVPTSGEVASPPAAGTIPQLHESPGWRPRRS